MATADATLPRRPDSVPGVDILRHDVYVAGLPLDAYDVYRAEAPVAWVNETPANGHTGSGFWAITRWDDIVAIHKDWRRFSSEVGGTEIEELDADAIVARRTMLETDPPRAEHARALVDDVLSDALRASHGSEPIDAVAMIARELPIRMLTGLLGVPEDDAPTLFHWTDQIVYHADPEYSEAVIDQTDTDPYRLLPFRSPTSLRVFDYVNRLAVAARGSDQGDVLSVLERALVDGVPLTDRERGTFFLLLLIAGNETTRHSLTQTLLALADHPQAFEKLRDDPALIDPAVEEALRWACPQIHFRRTATEDVELRGETIHRGDKVVTWYPAANFDPAQFAEPRRFDITREPNRHVTFGGGGPHLCLGQWMARLEVRALIEALIERVDRVERAGEVERIRSNFINGIKRAPLVLHAR
jgi:cytochrome P450